MSEENITYCRITFCPSKGPDYSKDEKEPMHLCSRHAKALGLEPLERMRIDR